MPGPNFAPFAAAATAAVDAIMGEPFAFQPMMRAPDRTAADVFDSSRAGTPTINAIFLDKIAKPNFPDSYDTRQQKRPGLESGMTRLRISPSEVARQAAANPAFDVKATDQFTRLSDGSVWRVSSIEPLAGGTLLCSINRLDGD